MTNIVRDDILDYQKLLELYPWLAAKKQKAIISPDTDGFLCGLFMAELLDWEIVGYYDGKAMVLRKGLSAGDCVFLDMDVFRKEIKSIGHHMVLHSMENKLSQRVYADIVAGNPLSMAITAAGRMEYTPDGEGRIR